MVDIHDYLKRMKDVYWANPQAAVRSQGFIQILHEYLEAYCRSRLSQRAINRGIKVQREAKLFGSHKPKDVDIAVIDPENGPLITIGVRSQMSSVGKNVLTYYQDIVGECISLQERFPMTTMGYVYLHPRIEPIADRKVPNHARYAHMYANIGHRDDRLYKSMVGSYDQFAYMVVDFDDPNLKICDDIVEHAVPNMDMKIETFVDRLIETFNTRNLWLDWVFKPLETLPPSP